MVSVRYYCSALDPSEASDIDTVIAAICICRNNTRVSDWTEAKINVCCANSPMSVRITMHCSNLRDIVSSIAEIPQVAAQTPVWIDS